MREEGPPEFHPDIPILFQDEHLVVVDKPSGLMVHPSAEATDRETCLSVLRRQTGQFVYPLHRLDRGTSGVLMMGFSGEIARLTHKEFAARRIAKRYLAVVRGWVEEEVTYDRPLKKRDGSGERVEAVTHIRPLGKGILPIPSGNFSSTRYSLVEAKPETGRRHQIRRHLSYNDHPILGDAVHGDGRYNKILRRVFGIYHLLLHAREITFPHPIERDPITISAPVPEDFARVMKRFEWELTESERR